MYSTSQRGSDAVLRGTQPRNVCVCVCVCVCVRAYVPSCVCVCARIFACVHRRNTYTNGNDLSKDVDRDEFLISEHGYAYAFNNASARMHAHAGIHTHARTLAACAGTCRHVNNLIHGCLNCLPHFCCTSCLGEGLLPYKSFGHIRSLQKLLRRD